MSKYLVDMQSITKNYDRKIILDELDLKIQPAEKVAIMGGSGSGKSTLLAILGLLTQSYTGRYQLNGIDTHSISEPELARCRSQYLGFVFQSFLLLPNLTVLENVLLPTTYNQQKNSLEHAKELLNNLNMREHIHSNPKRLSGGQQQRVAIARALINRPQLILADEPTGALDESTSREVMNYLITLNKQQSVSLLIVTHTSEVARRCDRILYLKNGRLGEKA